LALAAVSALTFVACVDSGDKPGSIAPVAQTGDCANIQDLLDKAIGDAAEANDAADESRGTPDGPSDANKAEAAEALVDELIEQKEECASAASTTSTSTSTTTSVATPNSSPTTATVPPDPLLPSADELAEFEDLTSVDVTDLRMQDRCNNAEFLDNSIRDVEKGDPNFRPSTDAPSTPFLEMTDEGKEAELLTENCGNPTLFDMSEQGLCALDSEIWGNICDNNPWLKECLGLADEHGLKAAFVNDDFTLVNGNSKLCAALTNKLIRDADLVGVVVEPSIENRHLPGPVAGGLPRTKLNPEQEGLPVLRFEFNSKERCVWAFGYNLKDKRWELLSCGPPAEPICTENCGGGGTTTTSTVPCTGDKNHIVNGVCVPKTTDTTTPTPSIVATTTTLAPVACDAETEHRDTNTGQCVVNDPPAADPAVDPSVPDGNNNGPVPAPGNPY
ncbi:MAG: hypothetical protein AAB624_02375, partial [Patescibacteria group bacterium]